MTLVVESHVKKNNSFHLLLFIISSHSNSNLPKIQREMHCAYLFGMNITTSCWLMNDSDSRNIIKAIFDEVQCQHLIPALNAWAPLA